MIKIILPVRGSAYKNRSEVEACYIGDSVRFEPEPHNQYDSNAIKILVSSRRWQGEYWVGYVPRESCKKVHRVLNLLEVLNIKAEAHGQISWVKEFPDQTTDLKVTITLDGEALENILFDLFRHETIVVTKNENPESQKTRTIVLDDTEEKKPNV